MRKKIILSILLLLLCMFLLGTMAFVLETPIKTSKDYSLTSEPEAKTFQTDPTDKALESKAVLEINGARYETHLALDSNVYQFMETLRREGKIRFTEKNYPGLGIFIETLEGIRGNGEKTWIYYVNGKKAGVGVSLYKINPGDVVTWKYEKLLAY